MRPIVFHQALSRASLSILALIGALTVSAETVTLHPVADTALHEAFPDNNFGAFPFVHGGTTGKNTKNRGLYRFELAGIPEGSRIDSVLVRFTITFVAPSLSVPEVEFGLHRMLTAWDEGTKDSSRGMGGRLATEGEATWRWSSQPGEWQSPGGSEGIDYTAPASSTAVIGNVQTYEFLSTPELVQDVQGWLDEPAGNFGWMLKSAQEDLVQSAKRFASRESATPPALIIEYSPPAPEVRITSIRVRDGQAILQWIGGTGRYQLQARDLPPVSEWANIGSPTTELEASTPAGGQGAFFRVLSAE